MKRITHIITSLALLPYLTAGAQTFVEGSITYAHRPDGTVEVVAGEGFYRGEVVIPATAAGKTVAALGRASMNSCHGLRSLTLPSTITSLDDYALNGCDSLTSLSLSPSLTRIGDHALARCETLKGALTIPECVTEIGNFAFFRCRTLTSIELPAALTSIGSRAFMSCNQLKTITVAPENPAYRDDAGILLTADGKTLVAFPRKHTSWRDCTVPNTVQHIADYAFYGCDAMKTITFPDKLQTIGTSAMEHCKALKSITLPASITSIGANAFNNCNALVEVHCQANNPPALNPYATPFGYLTDLSTKTLYVPAGFSEHYSLAPVWSLFGTIIEEGGSAVETIANSSPIINVDGNTIRVDYLSAEAHTALYRLDGTLVATGSSTFTVDASGLYLLRVDSETYKILIK